MSKTLTRESVSGALGIALQALLRTKGYRDQSDAAAQGRISPSRMSRWITGTEEPRISTLVPVLVELGVSLAELEDELLIRFGRRSRYREVLDRLEELEARLRPRSLAGGRGGGHPVG